MRAFQIAFVAMLLFSLNGCSSDSTPQEDANAQPISKTQIQAMPTPALADVTMTYRISGNARGVTGTYTDSTGAEVQIPATASDNGVNYVPLPWEKSVTIAGELIRKQHITVYLSARDAFGNSPVTVEILADGKSYNHYTAVEPRINIKKD